MICRVAAPRPPVMVLVHVVRAKSPAWIMANAHKLAMGRQIVWAEKTKTDVMKTVEMISLRVLMKAAFRPLRVAMDLWIARTGVTKLVAQVWDAMMVSLPAVMTYASRSETYATVKETVQMVLMSATVQNRTAKMIQTVYLAKSAKMTDVKSVAALPFSNPYVVLMATPTTVSA